MIASTSVIPEIDRLDRRILDVLQRDGRTSNLKLAEAVSLSPTAVLARVQRLTRDGFILGFEARLNPLQLGAAMMVFVEVLLDRTTPNVFEAFKAAVQVHPEIMECHMVAGGFDYLLKTRMADMPAYRNFAGSVLWQLPGVRPLWLICQKLGWWSERCHLTCITRMQPRFLHRSPLLCR
jgi:Lrp/AsnC family leucine-responsive transcriptional regulator